MAPQDFFPHLAGWVANLDDVFPGALVKPYFAQFEVGHLLALVVLGGSSILLNLRLIGVGLTDETPGEMHRNLSIWVHIGVIGMIVTGLLIGSSNAERLYASEAFSAKMVGLLAGVILTYGVTLPASRNDGELSGASRVSAVVGLAVFAVAICVFLSAKLANPGLWHVIFAAGLIVAYATRALTRIVFLSGAGLMIVAQQVMTHVVFKADDYANLDPTNKAFAWGFVAWILGAAVLHAVSSGRGANGGSFTKAMALAAILVWVMTAAAGRWLAFA